LELADRDLRLKATLTELRMEVYAADTYEGCQSFVVVRLESQATIKLPN